MSKHRCMLIYFFKYSQTLVSFIMLSFLFLVGTVLCLEYSILKMEQNVFGKHLRKDAANCSCALAIYCCCLWFVFSVRKENIAVERRIIYSPCTEAAASNIIIINAAVFV